MDELNLILSMLEKACANPVIYQLLEQLHRYDTTTWKHSLRVASHCIQLAYRKGFSQNQIFRLTIAALLHDIGKLAIPKEILDKPGKLTDEEYKQIQNHARNTHQILFQTGFPKDICEIATYHHRNYDESGYPTGQLPHGHTLLCIHILHICDTYEALASMRPYKPSLPHDIVLDLLKPYENIRYAPNLIPYMYDFL